MDVKEFLMQPQKLDIQIRNKLIERKQLRDIALGISANIDGDRVNASGSKSRMADAVDKLVDMEAEVDQLVDKYIDIKREVVAVIEAVDNPIQYNVLHMKYIQGMTLQGIADYYHKDYEWSKATHRRAIKSVQLIMDKKKSRP